MISCEQKANKTDKIDRKESQKDTVIQKPEYSDEFIAYFQKSGSTMKGDSIIMVIDSAPEIVRIPQHIKKNNEITFASDNGQTISIRQINFTDVQFTITYNGQQIDGEATLLPHFYLGTETVEFSDGEYFLTKYFATTSSNHCIDYIGLGNQNILNDESEMLYALVSMSGGGCENELRELSNRKLKTVANNVYN